MRCPSAIVRTLRLLAAILAFAAVALAGQAQTPPATATQLTITSNGSPASSVTIRTVVQLTATVTAGSSAVTPGQVEFCDASVAHCIGLHFLGMAQLRTDGTAVFKFRPAAGSHSYKAVFLGTNKFAASSSAPEPLTVSGGFGPSASNIAESGTPGNYTLTATVGGSGTTAPTGTVSFLDASNGNAVLGTATLGAGTPGLTLFPGAASFTEAAVTADFNGDGILDLAGYHTNGALSILLGNGDGTFTPLAPGPSTGQGGSSMEVGDFNSDGIPDLAIADYTGNSITVLQGDGDGTFTAKPAIPMPGLNPFVIQIGDFNRDGIPDLAVLTPGNGSVAILLGNGDGTFTAGPPFPNVTLSSGASFAVADLNGDGILDIAVVNRGVAGATNGDVSIFLGNGDGTFSATDSNPETGPDSFAVSVGDFNGDGVPDLAVLNWYSKSATILLGNGDGTFTATAVSPVIGTGPRAIVTGDFNGDGISDLAVADYSIFTVTLLRGHGDGTFLAPIKLAVSNPYDIVAGDFNGDGIQDLAVGQPNTTQPILTADKTASVATGIALPVATGSHQVIVSYAGDNHYVGSTSQAITLTAAQGTPIASIGASVVTAPYGTPITFSSTVSGSGLTPTGTVTFLNGIAIVCKGSLAGGTATCKAPIPKLGLDFITASYGGDSNYKTATSSAINITITQGTPTITWPTPAAIAYGTELTATQLDATANVPGAFVYSPGTGTVLTVGQQTLSVTFTPTDTTDYLTANQSVTLTVNKATPAITWAAPSPIPYGTPLSSTQLNATANVPGTFSYSPSAGTVLTSGAQTLTATFTPTDTTDYKTATKSASLTVYKATPAITWATPASITYGTPLSSTQLDATANVPGTFSYSPAAGTVLTSGAQTLTTTFTPTDTTNYKTATRSVTLLVYKATPVITWPTPTPIPYGTPLSTTQFDATANVPGTFDYSPEIGTVFSYGMQTLKATFIPADTTDYKTATKSVSLMVYKATPTLTWATPASITYGTPLSSTQLDATANVPGTFSYSPAAGTVLAYGVQTLTATFTPTNTTDYKSATRSVSLLVYRATPTITWPTPAPIAAGTALSSTQLDATITGVDGQVLPGTATYSPAAGTVLSAGTHTLTVNFTPTDSTDYKTATKSVTITVQ